MEAEIMVLARRTTNIGVGAINKKGQGISRARSGHATAATKARAWGQYCRTKEK